MKEFFIKTNHPISLSQTIDSHGWVDLQPWNWDPVSQTLSRLEDPTGTHPLIIAVQQKTSDNLLVKFNTRVPSKAEFTFATQAITRWLSLDWDPSAAIQVADKIDARIGFFIRAGGGRFLRCTTFYEDLVKTITTININWSMTKRMIANLVTILGNGLFPNPGTILESSESYLRKRIKLGFRSTVLLEATDSLLERGIIDLSGNLLKPNLLASDLLTINGIGPYTAHHVLMLCHNYSNIPVDSSVAQYSQTQFNIPRDQIQNYFEQWGQFRFLGYKLPAIMHKAAHSGVG